MGCDIHFIIEQHLKVRVFRVIFWFDN